MKKKMLQKVIGIVLAAGMLTGMLAGCGNSAAPQQEAAPAQESAEAPAEEEAEAPEAEAAEAEEPAAEAEAPAELTTVTIGYMPNYASLNSQIAADMIGAFEEQGIKIELVEFADGPTIIAAMESGSVSVGYIGPGAHKLCIEGRAKIIMTSHFGRGDGVLANRSHGIESIEDLAGKVVAYSTGTSSQTILEATLASAGMTMSDIKAMDMDASGIVTAMLSGSVDACATWSPGTYTIRDELGDDIVDLTDNTKDYPDIASWIVNQDFYDKNEDLIFRFTKGLLKGMNYRADEAHYEEVAKWVADKCALDYDTVLLDAPVSDWLTSDTILEMVNDGTLESYYKRQQDDFRAAGTITIDEVPVTDYVMFQNMIDAIEAME